MLYVRREPSHVNTCCRRPDDAQQSNVDHVGWQFVRHTRFALRSLKCYTFIILYVNNNDRLWNHSKAYFVVGEIWNQWKCPLRMQIKVQHYWIRRDVFVVFDELYVRAGRCIDSKKQKKTSHYHITILVVQAVRRIRISKWNSLNSIEMHLHTKLYCHY